MDRNAHMCISGCDFWIQSGLQTQWFLYTIDLKVNRKRGWIYVALDIHQWQAIPSTVMNFSIQQIVTKWAIIMRDVPKVMSKFFLQVNWEQQAKESRVVDGTSCCVILECLVTSIVCITWPISLLTKWPTTICHFASVLSSNSLLTLWHTQPPVRRSEPSMSLLLVLAFCLQMAWHVIYRFKAEKKASIEWCINISIVSIFRL
jgi:hypothetical protein